MIHARSTAPLMTPLISSLAGPPLGAPLVSHPPSSQSLGTQPAASARKAIPHGSDLMLQAALSHVALVQVAKRLYEVRQKRDAMLGEALFSEPAWDMLLDLFISDHEGRRLSVSAVCIGARSPSATALRYLAMLQDADLIVRTRDTSDGRRSHVGLTPLGRRRMVTLLSRLAIP